MKLDRFGAKISRLRSLFVRRCVFAELGKIPDFFRELEKLHLVYSGTFRRTEEFLRSNSQLKNLQICERVDTSENIIHIIALYLPKVEICMVQIHYKSML